MKGIVYFVQMVTGPIKVGFTTDLEKRLNTLSCTVPAGVTLLASIEATPDAEAWLHIKFRSLNISGEWFSPGLDLLSFIERAKTGRKPNRARNLPVARNRETKTAPARRGNHRARRILFAQDRRACAGGREDCQSGFAGRRARRTQQVQNQRHVVSRGPRDHCHRILAPSGDLRRNPCCDNER